MTENACNVETGEIRKKRGRKPNGGKIISKKQDTPINSNISPVIILHLKCRLKDLGQIEDPSTYEPYYSENHTYKDISDDVVDTTEEVIGTNTNEINQSCLYAKIQELEYNLHTNNINDKKSACFHCTYSFDNTQFYIPQGYINSVYKVYGCFCSPECAVSYLFAEHIDTSVKFDRYSMLNHMYGSNTQYMQNIKPAPNPYYTLSKFYGNLNIQEYRSLFKSNRLFMLVDKPIARCMPELYEDSDDNSLQFKINNNLPNPGNIPVKYKNLEYTQPAKLNIFLNTTYTTT
jgi:hypothetical protein